MAVTAILPVVLMTLLGVIDSRIICRSYFKVIFISVLDARVYVADVTCVLQGLNYTGVGILGIGCGPRGRYLLVLGDEQYLSSDSSQQCIGG